MADTRRCYLSERHSSRTSARNEARNTISTTQNTSPGSISFVNQRRAGYSYGSVSISDPPGNALLSTLFPFEDSPSRIKRAAILSRPSTFLSFFPPFRLTSAVLRKKTRRRSRADFRESISLFSRGCNEGSVFSSVFFCSKSRIYRWFWWNESDEEEKNNVLCESWTKLFLILKVWRYERFSIYYFLLDRFLLFLSNITFRSLF